jgi:vanillate O-demethylase monooxygenase subunit
VVRWILDREPPAYYAPLVKFEGNCDRLQHYEVRFPSLAINKSVFTPAGTGNREGALDPRAYIMVSYNFLTPINERQTKYFWFQHRNTDPDDDAITASISKGTEAAFGQRRPRHRPRPHPFPPNARREDLETTRVTVSARRQAFETIFSKC